MKALTICQPYAELIARKTKRVENRTWETRYRRPLLIHAGKSRKWLDLDDSDGLIDCCYGIRVADMTFGAVVAIATLADCVKAEAIHAGKTWLHLANHIHVEGPWCWVLEDVKRLVKPIPYRGAQGLFDIPDEVLAHG